MGINKAINILLVDDHAIVHEGYCSLFQKQADINVIGEAANAVQAYQCYQQHRPDVTIMDLSMPGQGGLAAIAHIKQRYTNAKILVFSMHLNANFAMAAMQAGALGYISKSSAPNMLLRAIYEVNAGRNILSPDVAQLLALAKTGHENMALASLSVREFEILRMIVEAHSKADIAKTLNISPKTVANCHYLIKRKLNVTSDIELLHLAIKTKIVKPSEFINECE